MRPWRGRRWADRDLRVQALGLAVAASDDDDTTRILAAARRFDQWLRTGATERDPEPPPWVNGHDSGSVRALRP